MTTRTNENRRTLVVLFSYLLLTLLLTYPLALNWTSHVAGDGSDDPALAWNLWWVRHALFDLGASPMETNYMFFPIGVNLAFYTLTYLNAFLSIPIQFAFGLIPAANFNLVLAFTLSGFGAYLLSMYLLRRWLLRDRFAANTTRVQGIVTSAAFAAGLVYAFSSNKFLYASLGQFNIASSQWIPFYVLFLLKILDSPRPPLKYGLLLGFFLLAQTLAEFIFGSFLILFTAAYLIYWLVTIRFAVRRLWSVVIPLLIALLVFVIPLSPILAAMAADTLREGDFIQQGVGFANVFSADLVGFFVPSNLHPLLGAVAGTFRFPYINFMFLGYTALALSILAVWKIRSARVWGAAAIVILLVTLGPTLRINGMEFDLPLPFDVLLEIPLVRGNRYPSRWSVMLTLCLALLVGYGIAWLLVKLREWGTFGEQATTDGGQRGGAFAVAVAAGIGLVLLFEHLSTPLPLSDLRIPSFYNQISREPGNWTVMELPLAWRNGFRVTGSYRDGSQGPIDRVFMLAQWYQTEQEHPILNGNTSRNPELKFQYFSETPVLDSLIAVQTGHAIDETTRERDRALAPQVLSFLGTRYIIWHTPYEEANRAVAERTRAYVEDVFPVTKIGETYEDGRGTVVYRVDVSPADGKLALKPSNALARLYLGEGWGALGGDAFWVSRTRARLFVPLATPRDLRLTLVDLVTPTATQSLTLGVNGQFAGRYDPVPNGAFSTVLPEALLKSGLNELTLEFDEATPLTEIRGSPLSVVVRSAGEEQGAFGHIYVNGVEQSPNRRGYNIVVINSQTGEVRARGNFDTFALEENSTRLAEFLEEQVQAGDIVAVAASDEASYRLTEEAAEALRALGAREDLRGKFRWSHALLAVKGDPASVREAASETQVSQVMMGVGLTEPTLAATIGEIRIE